MKLNNPHKGPGYLQLLALVSFHIFLQEGVDVAIYETHHSSKFCTTNVFKFPIATAITTIDVNHIINLNPDIRNIAWHKGGILKPSAVAFTMPQQKAIIEILRSHANKKGVSLTIVKEDYNLPNKFNNHLQQLNCSLAQAITDTFLQKTTQGKQPYYLSQKDILSSIQQFY